MERQKNELIWLEHPRQGAVEKDRIVIEAERYTAQGERICCGSRNDNAPVLLQITEEKNFSFGVKMEFDIGARFDQCGLVVHLDDDNCFRVMAECMHENSRKLVGLLTANGVSGSVSVPILPAQNSVYYRVTRAGQAFEIAYSTDGAVYETMFETLLQQKESAVRIGAYVCSPAEHYFQASFSEMEFIVH